MGVIEHAFAPMGDEEMARTVPDQVPLAPGELYRRLNALGWSGRAFADATGLHEGRLRIFDKGELPSKLSLVEQRARILRWLEMEERLRLVNPLPVVPGKVPIGAGAKQRRLRVSSSDDDEVGGEPEVSDTSEVLPAEVEEAEDGNATLAERMQRAARRVRLSMPEVPDLEIPEPGLEASSRWVRSLLDYAGLSPRVLAIRSGVPHLQRDIRRMANRANSVKPDARAWLEGVADAAASNPAAAEWHRRVFAFNAWRGAFLERLQEIGDEVRQSGPDDDALMEWGARVTLAAQDLPRWMRPNAERGGRMEMVDPRDGWPLSPGEDADGEGEREEA